MSGNVVEGRHVMMDMPEKKTVALTGEAQVARTKKILIIDDDPFVTEVLSRYITKNGYPVETARSAAGAIRKLEQEDFWAIFCDLTMSGLNGFELYTSISARKGRPFSRFVMITGAIPDDTMLEQIKEENILLCRKPFSHTDIARVFSHLAETDPVAEHQQSKN